MKMRIEPNGSGGRGKMSSESRKGKRRQKRIPAVQKLYDTCKEIFADCGPGIVPSPENVEKLAAVLDGMTQEDVGLRPNMPCFSKDRAPIITYMRLHECDKFSIGIFCLPPKTVIPLHNHPGMTVFSKLLFGTMHIRSLDWADKADDCKTMSAVDPKNDNGLCLAKVKVNSELTQPCNTSILYPADGGNMHRFTAKTACAVLDVLGPPYCDPEGRHCQYYQELPFPQISVGGDVSVEAEEEEGFAWLKEMEKPDDHVIVGVAYNGPKIVRK
ncbi:plant cysteine oxidase 1-like [Salvia hispanica]|uniref:plant cysteine oxidase 1-like n=1 Tax=Salvia hispanica TaxID=49212 RepID=UPI002008F6EB|nr:plant cysteine oxidase 1-like [Salvia hispanica]XP_047952882.1 plant cysteine oxidase 1-like [Salvia hispanica]